MREATDGSPDGVASFYLLRNASGPTFYTLVTGISSAQATLDGFNLSTAISAELQQGDYDANRMLDLHISGLSSMYPGAPDVIVYADNFRNGPPLAHVELNQDYADFFQQLRFYLNNPLSYTEIEPFPITHQGVLVAIDILETHLVDFGEDQFFAIDATAGAALADVIEGIVYGGQSLPPHVLFEGALRFPRSIETGDFNTAIYGAVSFDVYETLEFVANGIVQFSNDYPEPLEFLDSDGDGVRDRYDALPFDPSETLDNDGDGVGDNADLDDDNDRMPDTWELIFELDPFDWQDALTDSDGDGRTNLEEFLLEYDPRAPELDLSGGTSVAPPNIVEVLNSYSQFTAESQHEIRSSVMSALMTENEEFLHATFDAVIGVEYTFNIENSNSTRVA